MDYNRHRRRTGLILGLILGAGYALSSILVNRIALPGIPLYSPPPGEYGLFILTVLMFAALGLIAAWGDESLPSVLVSGLAGSLVSSIWIFANETANRSGVFALLLVVFLPRMFFYLPFGALVRWLINKLDQPTPTPVAPVRRLVPVVLSFLFLVFLGTFAIFPQETRLSLVRMQELLQTGLQAEAASRKDLPVPLQSVEGFVQRARGGYSFTVGENPDVLPVQRPVVEYGELEPFIIIRFENGFRFGCVFSPPYVTPACIDF